MRKSRAVQPGQGRIFHKPLTLADGQYCAKPSTWCQQPQHRFQQNAAAKCHGISAETAVFVRRNRGSRKKGRVADDQVVLPLGSRGKRLHGLFDQFQLVGPRRAGKIAPCARTGFGQNIQSADTGRWGSLQPLRQHERHQARARSDVQNTGCAPYFGPGTEQHTISAHREHPRVLLNEEALESKRFPHRAGL